VRIEEDQGCSFKSSANYAQAMMTCTNSMVRLVSKNGNLRKSRRDALCNFGCSRPTRHCVQALLFVRDASCSWSLGVKPCKAVAQGPREEKKSNLPLAAWSGVTAAGDGRVTHDCQLANPRNPVFSLCGLCRLLRSRQKLS